MKATALPRCFLPIDDLQNREYDKKQEGEVYMNSRQLAFMTISSLQKEVIGADIMYLDGGNAYTRTQAKAHGIVHDYLTIVKCDSGDALIAAKKFVNSEQSELIVIDSINESGLAKTMSNNEIYDFLRSILKDAKRSKVAVLII